MASTSRRRIVVERDAVSQSMSVLLESMSEENREQLDQWIPEIEEHAIKSIAELPSSVIGKRRPEILAAASLYHSFLEFESRTRLAIRTPFLSRVLDFVLCSVNQAYRTLFDRRIMVRASVLESISTPTAEPSKLVAEIITILKSALEKQIQETDFLVRRGQEQCYFTGNYSDGNATLLLQK
jgi:hypothetical protein